MTDARTVDRVMAHIRAHVAELRRMERDGAEPGEIEERKRVILRLQLGLASSVSRAVAST